MCRQHRRPLLKKREKWRTPVGSLQRFKKPALHFTINRPTRQNIPEYGLKPDFRSKFPFWGGFEGDSSLPTLGSLMPAVPLRLSKSTGWRGFAGQNHFHIRL